MLQCLKKVLRLEEIMRYKVFQFWFKLKKKFTFAYFMYPFTILQYSEKKNIKVDGKIQGRFILGQIALGYFWKKIDYF